MFFHENPPLRHEPFKYKKQSAKTHRALKYRAEIDGLRSVAVLPVILFHAGYPSFSGGYIGVDVFFVISGFLITSIISSEMEKDTFTIARFYERRVRRILPALFVVLLSALPFAWLWLMPTDLKDFTTSLWSVIYFGSNFLFWKKTDYFQTAAELKPLLHTWSLSVEEQFYIFYPPILIYSRRFGQKFMFSCLIFLFSASLIAALWGGNNAPMAAFFLLPHRGWELLAGALAAFYLRSQKALFPLIWGNVFSILGIALVLLSIFTYDSQTPIPGRAALVPVIGTVLILLFSNEGNLIGKVLSAKPFVWVGLVSYSAYLWHQTIFALFKQRFGWHLFDVYTPALIVLTLGLAIISYWFIERPFRKQFTLKQLTVAMASCFILTAGAAAFFNGAINDNKMNIPSYRWAVSSADPELLSYVERRDVVMECSPSFPELGFRQCDFGDVSQPKRLVLWGDSLGAALLYGLDKIAKEKGIGGTAFLADGCPPVLGLRNTMVPQCTEATNSEILNRIKLKSDFKSVLIVGNIVGAMHATNVQIEHNPTSPAIVHDRIAATASELRSYGAKTYILEQGPIFPQNISQYVLQNLRRDRDNVPISVSRASHAASVADVKVLSDSVDVYIGMEDFYCNEIFCSSFDRDGKMIVWDTMHPTKYCSIKIAQHVMDLVARSTPWSTEN